MKRIFGSLALLAIFALPAHGMATPAGQRTSASQGSSKKGKGSRSHGKAKAADVAPAFRAAPVETDTNTVEAYLQSLSTIPDVMNRRDPFIPAPAPFEARPELTDLDENPSAPVLERYPIQKYEVVATLLGDKYPRALIRLPSADKGKVLIVREKDKLGNRGGVIRRILKDGVAVVQSQRSDLGFVDKVETVLRVGVTERRQGGSNTARRDNSDELRPGMRVVAPSNAVEDFPSPMNQEDRK